MGVGIRGFGRVGAGGGRGDGGAGGGDCARVGTSQAGRCAAGGGKAAVAEWSTPYKIDPFTVSVEQNIELLLKIDAELRSVAGVTLAETNLNFNREEQWFVSSEGADIHQTKLSTGAGYAAYAFAGSEIQKRSYPNSYGGQWQNKGYELIEELNSSRMPDGSGKKPWRCIRRISARKGSSTLFWTARSWGCRFMSRWGIRLNWIACWGWRRILRERHS